MSNLLDMAAELGSDEDDGDYDEEMGDDEEHPNRGRAGRGVDDSSEEEDSDDEEEVRKVGTKLVIVC
jgi:transcription elongation factor SPT6